MISIGVDIGGTFADIVIWGREGQVIQVHKILTRNTTTRGDVPKEVVSCLMNSIEDCGIEARIAHATTLPSNTVIERKGIRVAVVANEGFRDILELGYESRFDLYNFEFPQVEPLVPREDRFEVSARTLADGVVDKAVDPVQVAQIAENCGSIEAVVVCLLHGYRFPEQENEIETLLRCCGFEGRIELSSRICPQIREYPRLSTTVLNAYISKAVGNQISTLEQAVGETGFSGSYHLMTSYGGCLPASRAQQRPVDLLESGAAASVTYSALVSRIKRIDYSLSFEMGGTTAKTALLESGAPILTELYEVARADRSKPGSGYPVQLPAVDVVEIGAGGGSVARINELGLVSVGPESAGSDPGPACYGMGGFLPTVTDACLVLGYLSPDGLLGGELPLNMELAGRAINDHIRNLSGHTLVSAAQAAYNVASETMANTARVHILEHGFDPTAFTLLAGGGAGPMFAVDLARRIGLDRVLILPYAGVGAAVGLAVSAPHVRVNRSRLEPTAEIDWDRVNKLVAEMKDECLSYLSRDDALTSEFRLYAKMRYRGQGHEITVPVDGPCGRMVERGLHSSFETCYRSMYGRVLRGSPSEIVGWQIEAGCRSDPARLSFPRRTSAGPTLPRTRRAYFDGREQEVKVYDRASLNASDVIRGPVIVEEREATTVIPPYGTLSVDELGNLSVDLKP